MDLEALARSVGKDIGLELDLITSPYDLELYANVKGEFRRVTSFATKQEARRALLAFSTIIVLKKQSEEELTV